MNQDPPETYRFPVEYWLIISIGLSASGLFYAAVAVVVWHFVLRRFPRSDWELLLVASGILGIATFQIFRVELSRANLANMAEHIVLPTLVLTLFFTRRRGCAWLLLVISVLSATALLVMAAAGNTQYRSPQLLVLAVIDLLWVWLLTRWLHRNRKTPNKT
jgi:hypothetical protein